MKQVILMRTDLKMSKGKIAAQAAHASVECVLKLLKSDKTKISKWRKQGMKKIVVKVSNKSDLHKSLQGAKDLGLKTCTITDAGHTFVAPGTITCGAIGPDDEEKIDKVTGKLKVL